MNYYRLDKIDSDILGPGERVGLWLFGCNRSISDKTRCKSCIYWSGIEQYNKIKRSISVESLFNLVDNFHISNNLPKNITISGGEPFDQMFELLNLIKILSKNEYNIMIYTGYKISELLIKDSNTTKSILKLIHILVDGVYIEELNTIDSIWRGSTNQNIYLLNNFKCNIPKYRKIQAQIYDDDSFSLVGIRNNMEV